VRGLANIAIVALASLLLTAAQFRGKVNFNGLPVPGATVVATQSGKTLTAVTDAQGNYVFPDLGDGLWTFDVTMVGFAPVHQDVTIAGATQPADWDLKMLPLDQIQGLSSVAAAASAPASARSDATATMPAGPPASNAAQAPAPPSNAKPKKGQTTATNTKSGFQRTEVNATGTPASEPPASAQSANEQSSSDLSQRAADGFLINGTANNAASSPFAQAGAFGNNRRGARSLYNGNIGLIFDNSALDARPFSLTGQNTAKLSYNHEQGVLALGGPLKIPRLLQNGPMFFLNYQWTRNRNASNLSGLVPTDAERAGDFSNVLNARGQPVQLTNPATGAPIPNNLIAASEISPQAKALLHLFPTANFTGAAYNFQIPVFQNQHQDAMQSRITKTIGRKDQVSGLFALQSSRSDNPNLFGFLDTTDTLGLNINAGWRHNLTPRLFLNTGVQFSRQATHLTPFFANRVNVSGDAGISGNNQEPINWGPPALNFIGGLTALSDSAPSITKNQTTGVSEDILWSRPRHNIQFGGDYRRQQFNILSQQNPRGSFTFTGAASGADFADFLLGVPDTSAIAFGNADKYLRAQTLESYVNDDWRVNPGFTLNAGVRWEYWSPISEKYGRLVNLDVAPGFSAVAPVVAQNPVGPLTHTTYPDTLMRSYKGAIQPRISFSWRPLAASSMVVRGGYGVYYNTSVYQTLATLMSQQSPLSKSLTVQNSAADPLTLQSGFNASPNITNNTFAVDPGFRPGYLQTWQVSVQRDLPGALVMIASYLGNKGTRAAQDFLPNTYPVGATNPCLSCPSGFQYVTSNGNSTYNAGQIQLRRRLQAGFTSTLQYTYSKAIDDAALGGHGQGLPLIAQNWLNLSGERGLSPFDQRHKLTVQMQYTSGMGIHGGALTNGWRGALLKQWTVGDSITVGTGTPLTPTYLSPVQGTGVTGPLRPDYTGAPLYSAAPGRSLNPLAFALPPSGQWGDAGRDSIIGPSQFSFNAFLGRTFTLTERFNLDFRLDANNALNHVTFPSWNTTISSSQFGLPGSANNMRNIQTTIRLRF